MVTGADSVLFSRNTVKLRSAVKFDLSEQNGSDGVEPSEGVDVKSGQTDTENHRIDNFDLLDFVEYRKIVVHGGYGTDSAGTLGILASLWSCTLVVGVPSFVFVFRSCFCARRRQTGMRRDLRLLAIAVVTTLTIFVR